MELSCWLIFGLPYNCCQHGSIDNDPHSIFAAFVYEVMYILSVNKSTGKIYLFSCPFYLPAKIMKYKV